MDCTLSSVVASKWRRLISSAGLRSSGDDEIPQLKQSLPDLSEPLVKAYYTLKRCMYLMCMGTLSTCMSVHPMLVAPDENLGLKSQTVETM